VRSSNPRPTQWSLPFNLPPYLPSPYSCPHPPTLPSSPTPHAHPPPPRLQLYVLEFANPLAYKPRFSVPPGRGFCPDPTQVGPPRFSTCCHLGLGLFWLFPVRGPQNLVVVCLFLMVLIVLGCRPTPLPLPGPTLFHKLFPLLGIDL